jgi:FkbM family methyltransferase
MTLLDDLNAAVKEVPSLPRIQFADDANADAQHWLAKKHNDGGIHEPATVAAFLALKKLRACKTIYDLGARWGYFALMARQIFEDAEITAIDMHPAVMETLTKNVGPRIEAYHAAISDECKPDVRFWLSGFNIFEEPEGGWQNLASIPGAMKERGNGNRGRGFAEVDFISLDAFTVLTGKRPDLIKIDVEGYQAKAIAGAVNTIKAYRPAIVIELHAPKKLERFETSSKATVQPLFNAGYRGFWCGNFRDATATFEEVTVLDVRHERLSLMVFVP